MNEKRTLQKCKKIMQMFQKSKPSSALKEREIDNSNIYRTSTKNSKQNIRYNRNSFYIPIKKNERSVEKSNLKPSYNRSTSSVSSAKKSIKSLCSASKSYSKPNFQPVYKKESRYEKIMKLKVKPITKKKQDGRNSYLNSSKASLKSTSSIQRSQSKQTRFEKIMKLKVHKPRADSTLKNYQPPREERRIIHKENLDENSILELKKCKQILKKQERQIEKQDRLWKVFERQRQLRLKQKQKKEKNDYERERSVQRRFDILVQKQLKKIQLQKQLDARKQEGFSTYLFPSY